MCEQRQFHAMYSEETSGLDLKAVVTAGKRLGIKVGVTPLFEIRSLVSSVMDEVVKKGQQLMTIVLTVTALHAQVHDENGLKKLYQSRRRARFAL
jgi:hypothetical protein